MLRYLMIVAIASVAIPRIAGGAENEIPVESRLKSVGLFKNGLAVVEETLTVHSPGVYRLDRVPQPVHGTFWVGSNGPVVSRMTTRRVAVPENQMSGRDLQSELAGLEVTIGFKDKRPRFEGTVLELEPPERPSAIASPNFRWAYSSYHPGIATASPGRFLILRDAHGSRVYVDTSSIESLHIAEAEETVMQKRPALLLEVSDPVDPSGEIAIRYLATGLSWAPSYRVDLLSKNTLRLEQKAVVRNELVSLDDAEVSLITGYPSIPFAHVTSPFSMGTNWQSFFNQLRARPQQMDWSMMNSVMAQQAASVDRSTSYVSAPEGEGADLHYQRIGKRTLERGDAMALSVDAAVTSYSRLVEWTIPDTRRPDGRPVEEHERRSNPDRYEDSVWDALRFRNPLPFPLTTAAVVIAEGGRFAGQGRIDWTNRREETTLRITHALSVSTHHKESEVPGSRETVRISGDDHRKSQVAGTLRLGNQRNEPIEILIKRRFSGELIEAQDNPETRLPEEGAWSLNPRNELTWRLHLKPGEKKEIAYRYSVLVDI